MDRTGLPIQFLRSATMGTRVGFLQFGNDETESESLPFGRGDHSDSAMIRPSGSVFHSVAAMFPVRPCSIWSQ